MARIGLTLLNTRPDQATEIERFAEVLTKWDPYERHKETFFIQRGISVHLGLRQAITDYLNLLFDEPGLR